jgi:hypothetical protein
MVNSDIGKRRSRRQHLTLHQNFGAFLANDASGEGTDKEPAAHSEGGNARIAGGDYGFAPTVQDTNGRPQMGLKFSLGQPRRVGFHGFRFTGILAPRGQGRKGKKNGFHNSLSLSAAKAPLVKGETREASGCHRLSKNNGTGKVPVADVQMPPQRPRAVKDIRRALHFLCLRIWRSITKTQLVHV